MFQPHNRHMSFSVYTSALAVSDSIVLLTGKSFSAARFLPTAREDSVITGVCHSVHNRPYDYSVTPHPCYSAVSTHSTGMLSCFTCVLLIITSRQ